MKASKTGTTMIGTTEKVIDVMIHLTKVSDLAYEMRKWQKIYKKSKEEKALKRATLLEKKIDELLIKGGFEPF